MYVFTDGSSGMRPLCEMRYVRSKRKLRKCQDRSGTVEVQYCDDGGESDGNITQSSAAGDRPRPWFRVRIIYGSVVQYKTQTLWLLHLNCQAISMCETLRGNSIVFSNAVYNSASNPIIVCARLLFSKLVPLVLLVYMFFFVRKKFFFVCCQHIFFLFLFSTILFFWE